MIESIILFTIVFIVTIFLKNIAKQKKKSVPKKYSKRNKNYINSKKGNLYNTISTSPTYQSITDLAIYFNVEARELNEIFKKQYWAEQSGNWWVATAYGLQNGAKQEYNARTKQKYILWDTKIKQNTDLVHAIDTLKTDNLYKSHKESSKNSMMTKKEKGDRYEEYVAKFFKDIGYYVWEHGKEKGVRDGGIDLFVKNGKHSYFVQCKDWENWKIVDKAVKATQTDVRNYMIKNPGLTKLLGNSKKKILYVTSKECLTKGAYRYIEENQHIIEYKVIAY